jgi:uncharacterized membrane protein YjgN (DUF898 family)
MSEVQFDVVFRGVVAGFDTEQVQLKFAQLFSMDSDKVSRLFAAQHAKLKSNVTELVASQFVARLAAIGVHAEAVGKPMDEELSAPQPVPADQVASENDNVAAKPAVPVRPPVEFAAATGAEGNAVEGIASSTGTAQTMPFEFTGKGFEYFKIWIVNILLSIVTLGIYSAWAKVRNHQYFYGNTHLHGITFEYTAKPLQILRGRIMAFVLLVVYSILANASPLLAMVVGLVFLIALPWIVVSSLRFNARNTSYRNIAFRFGGTVGGALKAFILWPFLGLFSLGLLLPFAWKKQTHYIIANHSYGRSGFNFAVNVIEYYKVIGVIVAGGLVFAGVLFNFFDMTALSAGQVGAGALMAMLPMMLLYLAFYLAVAAYFVVAMANIQLNGTGLVQHRFSANWRVGSYALLLLVNTLGILFTLGLFIPFAKVRIAAYKAAHTQFVAQGDLNDFVAAEKEQVGALGEGVNDLFDVDISI